MALDGLGEFYSVSDRGRVTRTRLGPGTRGGLLKIHLQKVGYYGVRLTARELGIRKLYYIHDLVATAFIGPKPEGYDVNHIDFDKQNNRPENLEFVTRRGNQRHAATFGARSDLTPDQAREIRRRYQSGESPTSVGREFGVRRGTVWAIGTYRTWTDLDATIQRVLP